MFLIIRTCSWFIHSFKAISGPTKFILLIIVPIFYRTRSMCSFFLTERWNLLKKRPFRYPSLYLALWVKPRLNFHKVKGIFKKRRSFSETCVVTVNVQEHIMKYVKIWKAYIFTIISYRSLYIPPPHIYNVLSLDSLIVFCSHCSTHVISVLTHQIRQFLVNAKVIM